MANGVLKLTSAHLDSMKRVEIVAWILEEIYGQIDDQAYIVEEYPAADRLEVERRPLINNGFDN